MLGNERKLVQYGSGKQCSVSVRGEHALCRRLAKFLQDAVAQSLGIAFARFRKTNDLVCDYFVGKVAAISKSQRYQRHFVCEAHDPDRFGIEFLACGCLRDQVLLE